jgi:hypothetical protein
MKPAKQRGHTILQETVRPLCRYLSAERPLAVLCVAAHRIAPKRFALYSLAVRRSNKSLPQRASAMSILLALR